MRTGSGLVRRLVGPSLTATLVASVRALYSELPEPYRVAPDRAAPDLVPGLLALPARAARNVNRSTAAAIHVGLGTAFLGVTYHVALRTQAIDDALREGVRRGVTQVVLLGAGLDNRAARLDELARLRVFEVDHPATQAYKDQRLAIGGWERPANVTLVPVDFERERLDEALRARGLSATERTFWIWEGVTVYLTREAIAATLAAVARCSAPGSRLALTYTRPGSVGGGVMWGATALLARVIGEPIRGMLSEADLAEELARAGFSRVSDESAADWAHRVWGESPRGLREWERLAVAERLAVGSG